MGKKSVVGDERDFEERRRESIDLSGVGDKGGIIPFGKLRSSTYVFFVGESGILTGEDGSEGLNELKKLTANAGFSRIINRNRKSSFR